ncbi:valacyclovir hydrolase-like [Solenopsis invicta]|uniref:valacyclovir hydrolase-like n=1 Tax=Solenopsis invicta TaxID=13686 RepID=UPI00193E7336|nr:valacyclovir hydrolase-like [Solenopsis invicta]
MANLNHLRKPLAECKIKINDKNINYIRVGTGDHPVLLLPGALMSIWLAYKSQIEGLNADKLTIVAWDPPGYGKSRPPDKTFQDDYRQRDAEYAHTLMKTLGYSKFSLIGTSDGGVTSLLLASMYPESIRKMIVVSSKAYMHPDELQTIQRYRNINLWPEKVKAPLIQFYGEDYFKKMWSLFSDYIQEEYRKHNGDLCKQILSKIKCSTLIIHGAKDEITPLECSKYLKQNIANSKLHIFETGTHNLHLHHSEKFNNLVTNFLLGPQSKT